MKKGFLSVLLTLGMVLAVMPVTAYAAKFARYCDHCNGELREAYISGYQLRNPNYHYVIYSCTTCKHVFPDRDLEAHSFSGTATCTTGRICDKCGYEYGALGHNYISTVTQAPTCTQDGVRTYVCKNDSSHTYTEPIPAAGHNLEKVEKKDAGCTEDGYETYWKCNTCKKLFSDAAGTVEISNPTAIKATGHNLKKVEKKDATATEEGNSTYWFCDKCNKYFSDAKAETEIKKEDTVLAKLSTVNKKETEASSAKTANATKVTSTTDKTTKSSPKTGDSTDVQLYVILMLVSIGAAAGAGAKRKLKTQR